MKITCDSCGSNYTIADAKVAGRKVKVRCKGCKASILVDGTQIGENLSEGNTGANAASTGDDNPKKDLWSVNLSDEESRDMTLDELVAGWKSGTVTEDAYVWKDGMGDWKPILEVGELKLKLGSPKKAAVISSAAVAPAAVASGGKKVDDLFGAVDAAGDEPAEPQKPTGAPLGGDTKPTGARNDSSVLFSLDSLKGAGDGAPKKESSAESDLFGDLGGFGGGLSTNTDLLMAPPRDPPVAPAGVRTAVPMTEGKGKGGLIAAIVGGAAVIAAVLFFTLSSGGGDDAAAEEAKKAAEAAKAELEAERKKLAEEREQMMAELKRAREDALKRGEDPAQAAAKRKAELEEQKKAEEEAKKQEEDEKAKEAAASSAARVPAGTSSPAPSPKPASAPSPAPAPKPSGAPAFNVAAARAALNAAAANAAACAKPGGPTGSGKVLVTFAPSGRVTSSNVISGPFGGTAVGGCVASTFRRARVPAFSGDSQKVAKSFTIN